MACGLMADRTDRGSIDRDRRGYRGHGYTEPLVGTVQRV